MRAFYIFFFVFFSALAFAFQVELVGVVWIVGVGGVGGVEGYSFIRGSRIISYFLTPQTLLFCFLLSARFPEISLHTTPKHGPS